MENSIREFLFAVLLFSTFSVALKKQGSKEKRQLQELTLFIRKLISLLT